MLQSDATTDTRFSRGTKGETSGDVDPNARAVHDLGNLIQVASSAINMLARAAPSGDDRTKRIVASALLSLKQADELVRQTLKGARSNLEVSEVVDVEHVLVEIESLCHATWDERFRFHLRVGGKLPRVLCDLAGFRNAILNLLANARDAMPNGGDIGLAAISRDYGGEVEICVADNGVGMSEETVARALEPFFTTKADGLGGIGLPSVDRFVRDTGGRLEIQSKRNVGTIVMMRLPGAVTAPAE